jgi:hypothetical protein
MIDLVVIVFLIFVLFDSVEKVYWLLLGCYIDAKLSIQPLVMLYTTNH